MTGFPLYHCDDPTHGYCFHLDNDLSELTEQERLEWKELAEDNYLDAYETLAEVDEAIEQAEAEASSYYDQYEESESYVDQLRDYRKLLEKKKTPKPKRERFFYDYHSIPLGFDE
jgi:hypothetical protein